MKMNHGTSILFFFWTVKVNYSSFAALLQQNLLSLPSQSQTGLLQHQPGLALTPQVFLHYFLFTPVTMFKYVQHKKNPNLCRLLCIDWLQDILLLAEKRWFICTCFPLHMFSMLAVTEILLQRCICVSGYESLWTGRTTDGEPHGHVPPADAQTHGGATAGRTQWSGGTRTVC